MTSPPPPQPERPTASVAPALGHVLLAGVLGVVVGLAGAPVLLASLFGGLVAVLCAALLVAGVATALAVGLDRTAGPGGTGRPGSLGRGLAVGGLGSAAAMGLAWWGLEADLGDSLPVPLWYTAAAAPFAVLAALQWSGVVRIVTAIALVSGAAAVVVPAGLRAADEHYTQRIVTEVGTIEKPWVTEVVGYRLGASQVTGSPLIWTRLEADDGRADSGLWLFRDRAVDPGLPDPCAAFSFWTPGGDQPLTACTPLGDGRWLRTSETWQELTRLAPEVRTGVSAAPTVPLPVLEAALAAARPMTDAEYDTWLEEGLTPGW
ncbi:hypothetical protein [Blastococcus tunisiensis]|uniref:hypothetical protein n=1 Tax=Blastococcus tunisiensis TaxID=1798228 RepID=UPI0011135F09|nr:hypothetical protein [Blastococcus sp. DSM 46838]